MTITQEQLAEWQALTEAATPGPWRGDRDDGTIKYAVLGYRDETIIAVDHKNGTSGFLGDNGDNDEKFVTAAREAMPALLAEVKRQAERAEAAEALAARLRKYNEDLASERNSLQMRLWKIDDQAKRIEELESQLAEVTAPSTVGGLPAQLNLAAALADLGILDRLAAVESAARHLEKSAK